VKQLFDLLGIGKGQSLMQQVASIMRIIQAVLSAIDHYNERLAALEGGKPAPVTPAAPASASPVTAADMAQLEADAARAAGF
jgi:hypothetical protein